jgi:hypothetical protein
LGYTIPSSRHLIFTYSLYYDDGIYYFTLIYYFDLLLYFDYLPSFLLDKIKMLIFASVIYYVLKYDMFEKEVECIKDDEIRQIYLDFLTKLHNLMISRQNVDK